MVFLSVTTLTYALVFGTSSFVGYNKFDAISSGVQETLPYLMCNFKECCHKDDRNDWIHYENACKHLKNNLDNNIHGQTLIVDPIVNSIKRHLNRKEPPKALVLYFSGWTGTGKTYTSKLIAKSLYKLGMKSKYVKFISAVHHFPSSLSTPEDISLHQRKLRDMIRETVQQCDRSLIIIDEIDKLPAGVIDALKPLIDHNWDIDHLVYRKSIFILMSNTGSEMLKEFAYWTFKNGKSRDESPKSLLELETILKTEASKEKGGLSESTVLDQHLINLFVPFLPLERKHIEMCIEDEIREQNVTLKSSDERAEFIENIANELTYIPEEVKLFSRSGCKTIYEKVSNHASMKDEL